MVTTPTQLLLRSSGGLAPRQGCPVEYFSLALPNHPAVRLTAAGLRIMLE